MAKTHSAHTDSATLVRTLDVAERMPGAVALRERGYESLGLKPDATVVDVGCGTGRAVGELSRRIIAARADTIPHPRIARAYRNLLLDGGFTNVTFEVHTAIFTDASTRPLLANHAAAARDTGAITAAEAEQWIAEQDRRAAAGRLVLVVPMFLAAGTR